MPDPGIPLGEALGLALTLLASGAAVGLIAGLLGVGGGIVAVPVLFYVFGAFGVPDEVRMHLAVGTSLATIVPTSIRSWRSHDRRGAVDGPILRHWGAGIVAGVVLGSLLVSIISGASLTLIFASMALIVAANLAFGREEWRLGARLPGRAARILIATIIGALSTLMGIGGGTFSVTIMTLYGVPIHRAVGTSAALGLVISLPATAGLMLAGLGEAGLPPFSVGYVNLLGFALIVPASVLAAPLGVALAHRFSRRTLTRVFALFLALTSARMFLEYFG